MLKFGNSRLIYPSSQALKLPTLFIIILEKEPLCCEKAMAPARPALGATNPNKRKLENLFSDDEQNDVNLPFPPPQLLQQT